MISSFHKTQSSFSKRLWYELSEVASFELISLVEDYKKSHAPIGRTFENIRCFQVARDILRGESQSSVAERHGIALGTVRADVKLVIMWSAARAAMSAAYKKYADKLLELLGGSNEQ